jgi:hypothetical protein
LGGVSFLGLDKDDGAGWTVLFACSTLYAQGDIDVALGVPFLNGVTRTSHDTRTAQDTFVSDYVGHCSLLDVRVAMLSAI